MLKCALIGFGYWGEILLRNLLLHNEFQVCFIGDINSDNIKSIQDNYPTITVTDDSSLIVDDKEIEVVLVSSLATSHYEIVKRALLSCKHVLVEKPMTCSYEEALELHTLAIKKNLILMVDHILLYTEAVQKLKELFSANKNNLIAITCERLNNGRIPTDVNVIWDLGPHDISVLNYITEELPVSVKLVRSTLINGVISEASIEMYYSSFKKIHLELSWVSNTKRRATTFYFKDTTITLDEAMPNSTKIKVEKLNPVTAAVDEMNYIGIQSSFLPLTAVLNDFAKSVKTGVQPLSNSAKALDVISILEAIDESYRNNGQETKVYYFTA